MDVDSWQSAMIFLLVVLLSSSVCLGVPMDNRTSSDNNTSTSVLLKETCGDHYSSLKCLKLAMAGFVPVLAVPRRFSVWPGLALVSGGFETGAPPSASRLDGYLARGLHSFLASLSLHVNVVDQQVSQGLRGFSRAFIGDGEEAVRGRRKKVNNALILGGLLSAGTMLALGMAAISAMAGKALLMSLLSTGMMMMMTRNGSGNGGGSGASSYPKTTYEIIHTVPHEDYVHRHWADAGHDGYQVIKGH